MTAPRSSRAVTLVELLVVMSIITMLASMLVVMATSVTRRMSEDRTRAGIQMLRAVLELYRYDCGMYPDAINHDPLRHKRNLTPPNAVEMIEPNGNYPMSRNPNRDRGLYVNVTDETTRAGRRPCTQLVGALCSPDLGWSNPQFFNHFKGKDLNRVGQLIDAWGRRYFYMSAVAYRYRNQDQGKPGGGTAANGRNGGPFHNADSYQIYSAGLNSETYWDHQNRAGTDEDDITNW